MRLMAGRAGTHQRDELVPAEPGHQLTAGVIGEPASHRDQHLVTDDLPVRLVDPPEVVDIHHHGRQRPPGRVGQHRRSELIESPPVEQTSEGVLPRGDPFGEHLAA